MRFTRACLLLSAIGTLFLAGCHSSPSVSAQPGTATQTLRKWNVVVVTVDTLRPDHLHAYGYHRIETPTLDALAARGVLFENATAQTPLTPPSHASIFTGQNPNVHKVRNTGGFILPASSHPLARLLQEQGWQTGAFVASVVLKKQFGFGNGFAVYDDDMPRAGSRSEVREDPERKASVVVDHAINWLDQISSEKPFMLWVHLYDPHHPYNPPAEFAKKYKTHPYDGEIAYADQQLGRLFAAVDKKSSRNTIVAVLSDHGESLGEHGEQTHGVFLYDSTLRIAFIMAGPGIPKGLRVKQQARSIDFLPTVLEALGGRAPEYVQGMSLFPTFSGKRVATDVSFAETLYPKMNMNWSELRGIRTNRWKYIRAPRPELYDLASDPGESTNLIRQNAPESEKLEKQLQTLLAAGGSGGVERVETTMMDPNVMAKLKSLGYLSGNTGRTVELTGSGRDPKDMVGVLKLSDMAESSDVNFSEAKRTDLLRQALAADPQNPSLYDLLGARLEKNGHRDEALQLYRTALGRGIENARLHSRIADLLVRRGNKDEAITEYERAASINPTDLDSANNLATIYLEKGRLADAERVFGLILATDPGYAAAQNGMGLIAIQNKDAVAAKGYFEKAVQLNGDLAEAHMNLGLLYEMEGDRARARASFEKFLAKASPVQYAQIIPKVRQELATLQ